MSTTTLNIPTRPTVKEYRYELSYCQTYEDIQSKINDDYLSEISAFLIKDEEAQLMIVETFLQEKRLVFKFNSSDEISNFFDKASEWLKNFSDIEYSIETTHDLTMEIVFSIKYQNTLPKRQTVQQFRNEYAKKREESIYFDPPGVRFCDWTVKSSDEEIQSIIDGRFLDEIFVFLIKDRGNWTNHSTSLQKKDLRFKFDSVEEASNFYNKASEYLKNFPDIVSMIISSNIVEVNVIYHLKDHSVRSFEMGL
jgi:hypothetical protein